MCVSLIEANLAQREQAVCKSLSDRIVDGFAVSYGIAGIMFAYLLSMRVRVNETYVALATQVGKVGLLEPVYLVSLLSDRKSFRAVFPRGIRGRGSVRKIQGKLLALKPAH